jgi:hypothetical protein
MADDYSFPLAGGTAFAADEIGTTKHQRVKLAGGPAGSATDVVGASPLALDLPTVKANAAASASSKVLRVQPINESGFVIAPPVSGGGGSGQLPYPTITTTGIEATLFRDQPLQLVEDWGSTSTQIVIPYNAKLVVTGYSLAEGHFPWSGSDEPLLSDAGAWEIAWGTYWQEFVDPDWLDQFVVLASGALHGEGARMEYSGGLDAPAFKLDPTVAPDPATGGQPIYLALRAHRWEGTLNTLDVHGHVSFYWEPLGG